MELLPSCLPCLPCLPAGRRQAGSSEIVSSDKKAAKKAATKVNLRFF